MSIIYSVIIPTLNQAAKLRMCLQHLADLNFDPNCFEVIVTDNGSTDETELVAKSYSEKIKRIRYYYCGEPGLMAARHMGCEEAKGEILCYLDDDSLVNKEWLNGIAESFSEKAVVIATGPCIPKYEIEPPAWLEYFWEKTTFGRKCSFLSLFDYGNEFKMIPPVNVYGCNFSIRKKIFLEYGGTLPDYYPEKYRVYTGNGESGLTFKLQNNGFLAAYNQKSRIEHFIPSSRLTLDYFCSRRYFNGIHESYHDVRKRNGLHSDQVLSLNNKTLHTIRQNIRQPLRWLKRYIFWFFRAIKSPEVASMKMKLEESYYAGYAFHQKSLQKDSKLLEWVLRKNYMGDNGKLPI